MRKHLRFYRSFFPLFHFSQFSQKNLFVISTHKQQYPQHFYRSFFPLFHFSRKKIHFVNSTQASTDRFFSLFHFSQNSYTFYWFENFHELWAKNLSFHIRHKNCYKLICVPHLKLWNLPNYKSWIWYEMTCFLMFL